MDRLETMDNKLGIKDRLIEELHTLCYSGVTRKEAKKIFSSKVGDSKRGKTWVDERWPDENKKEVGTLKERDANLLELHELFRTGSTMREAMAALEGKQSQTWVRVHWPENTVVPLRSIYANQNITPSVRQVSFDEWGEVVSGHCDVTHIMT